MQLCEKLTKENFWNAMYEQFPNSMKHFCAWVDEYKRSVDWVSLFAPGIKFHDITYEMQQGIWILYASDVLGSLYEQPEYEPTLDLEEEIKTVFGQIEADLPENGDC